MSQFGKVGLWVVACGCAQALGGCNKETQPSPEYGHNPNAPLAATAVDRSRANTDMTPASRTRSATEQIAQARCEREQRCDNIGQDKTYSSAQDCRARIQNDWKDDLSARQCPGGINEKELNECLEQVRSEACGNPFDTLARLTECTSGQICIERP